MRHGVVTKRFDRPIGHRQMMFRNLVTEVLDHEKITTTEPKAKVLRALVDKMITLGKEGGLHSRRQAAAYVVETRVTDKLFNDIGKRYSDRHGGYTRIIKIGLRQGDGASMCQIELVK